MQDRTLTPAELLRGLIDNLERLQAALKESGYLGKLIFCLEIIHRISLLEVVLAFLI